MKLLQNSAGNFLNMTPQEARAFAAKLLKAADGSKTAKPGRGSGFVQTIVIRDRDTSVEYPYYGALDTIFVGVETSWVDVHPELEPQLQKRQEFTMHINRNDVNVRLKDGSHQ